MRALAILALVTALALAGCSGGGGKKEADPTGELGLEATDTTGVIRGVVVDEAITPLAGAVITIEALGKSVESTDLGAFGFQDLEPGTYFMSIAKPGYKTVQQSADVEAGVDDPDIVKVLMTADITTRPSYEVFHFQGYLECSFVAAIYFIPCEGVGNDLNAQSFAISGNASWIHVSLVWEATQAFGRNLYYNVLDNYNDYNTPTWGGGPSPLFGDANRTEIEDSKIDEQGEFIIEVASDGESAAGATPGLVGASIKQGFDAFVVVFHGFEPPEGYNYVEHGDPKVPE